MCLCKQGCPDASDVPRMVSRCADKLDLDHLLRDLPKYKPWVSPQAWSAWEEFMRSKSGLTEQEIIPGPLPALLSNAIRSAHQRAIAATPAISCETASLISKETVQPAKVK